MWTPRTKSLLPRRALVCALLALPVTASLAPAAAAAPHATEFSAGLQPSNARTPTHLAPGPDGNVSFTDPGTTHAIGQITPTGTITEFTDGLQASNASRPHHIARGADGNLWFTDEGGTKAIGR